MAQQQPPDRLVNKVNKYWKETKVKAIPFDKGCGSCLMKEDDYTMRLTEVLSCRQFTKLVHKKGKPLALGKQSISPNII